MESGQLQVLNQVAQEQLAPWVKDEEVSDAVFRTMATIPMEWVGHTDRDGLPFDVEEVLPPIEGRRRAEWLTSPSMEGSE